MHYLLSISLLLFTLAPRDQKLPEAFYKLPSDAKEKATVVVSGSYVRGRGPCIFMPDGSRRWALESWFQIKKVYRGEVGGPLIYVNSEVSTQTEGARAELVVDHEYLLLLKPNVESMKAIKSGDYVPHWDALHDDEIVAIVELK